MTRPVQLAANQDLSPAQLEAVANGAELQLSQQHWQAVQQCYEQVQQLLQQRARIYGLTTGYGPLADTYIDPADSASLQRNLIYHLSSGTGPLLAVTQVRAIMAARVATLARGHSGVHPKCLKLLLACLNQDLIPVVPSLGTVGASGDLTPLAHIARGLLGEGNMHVQGQLVTAADALAKAKLEPLAPTGKDALALVNGTSAMTAIAGLNQQLSERLLTLSVKHTVLYGEVLSGSTEALQPGLGQLRPHAGQCWAHQQLLAQAEGSERLQAYAPPPQLNDQVQQQQAMFAQAMPQDAYSFRCAPQHLGAVYDTLKFHQQTVTTELASVTDNPVFLNQPDGSVQVLHGGNFFGQHIALAADALNNALLTLAIHSERRIARVTDDKLNQGLPPFVRGNNNGLHSGFMGAQVTASALVAELRTHAHPASIQSIPTNANNQDVVTMGTIAARRCAETLQRLSELLAIEAMILAQAAELRHASVTSFSPASQAFIGEVRKQVKPLGDDRSLADDIQRLAHHLQQPGFNAQLV
ncbi:histidine ammonia-lyase [Pseudidiomarina planktonica]|uniref:Histidine ammonia-lyase n=1 Tax=Pseudidiomarina planktonica TaxID=1323738 RepID=A0A1Y6G3J4_9GAMM|nr:aromatic amino acid ammonia-lyase [Pseudidiomarina planktonica]RUO63263.1 aromatic amino acid lyase [Pseudidiomarina planktonica]SMQ80523.1 histidine ammonia-lyase [Pseudidiomarina planktonica]